MAGRRLLRRIPFVILGVAAAIAFAGTLPGSAQGLDVLADGAPVKVRTKPIETFRIGGEEAVFGKLTFLGGLEILSSSRETGGLSGLISLDEGAAFLAVTDNGHWVAGQVEQTADGKPLAITDLRYSPLLGADGKTLDKRWGHDTEALTRSGASLYVTAETRNAIYRYPWPLESGSARMLGQLALPEDIRALPRNKGLETLAAAPDSGRLAGRLIAVSETAPSDLQDLKAFIIGKDGTERFAIRRTDQFDATDAVFLPDGDFLLLERRFNLRDLIGMRLRRFRAADVRPGALLEGETLLEADFGYQIDNMEALGAHRNAAGETILTLVSDDNRSILQRTVFLRFRLEP